MAKNITRKPIANFFIIKDLQLRLIFKIVFSSVVSTLVALVTLLFIFRVMSGNSAYYQISGADIGDRLNIVSIIYPAVIISGIINIIIAFAIGLYASRKYAVPVFKLEQWADFLKEGHFTAKLVFREKEEMRELSSKCNSLAGVLCDDFSRIRKSATELQKIEELENNKDVKEILAIVNGLVVDDKSFNIKTGVYKLPDIREKR